MREIQQSRYEILTKNEIFYETIKRGIDILISFIALIFLVPLLLFISISIKCSSKGPIIFRQYRIGKDNKKFIIYKFRTMTVDTPEMASSLLKNPNKHITNIGSLLRSTSLDELPQLLNILKGDMSIVGPRPLIESEKTMLNRRTELEIHKLIPGLTGWAQVNGRNNISVEYKIHLESEYKNKRSFLFDFKIIFMTVFKVLKQEGVLESKNQNVVEIE